MAGPRFAMPGREAALVPDTTWKNTRGIGGFSAMPPTRLPVCQVRPDVPSAAFRSEAVPAFGEIGGRMRLTGWSGMTAGLAVGTTLAVVLAAGTGAYFYSRHHSARLLDNARETARTEGELIRDALEYQMLEDDRTLIARHDRLVRQAAGCRAGSASRSRRRRASSRARRSTPFRTSSRTRRPARPAISSRRRSGWTAASSNARGGAVLRTVIPIRNKPECHECHDPADRINGVLMLDMNMQKIRAGMDQDLRWMTIGTAALTLLLIAGIALVVRFADLATSAAVRDDGAADRERRPAPARARRRVRYRFLARPRVQYDGRLDDRTAAPGPRTAASGSRPSSTASTTASWCSIRAECHRRQRCVSCSGPDALANVCWAHAAARSDQVPAQRTTVRPSAVWPHEQRQVRIMRTVDAGRHDPLGGSARLTDRQ